MTFYEKEVTTVFLLFFFFPCTSQRRQRCKASRKSNWTVWGEWCNLSFTKELLWVQAVEVFERDCGCLTSAGFYRYRCRICCWFFFAARATSQNVASHTKKKLKKRKDGLGLCSLYLSLCVPPADQTSCDCVKKVKPQQPDFSAFQYNTGYAENTNSSISWNSAEQSWSSQWAWWRVCTHRYKLDRNQHVHNRNY